MIQKSNGKIGFRELSTLIFLVIGVKGADMTPYNLFSDGLNATWMFPFIWILFMALPFLALVSLLKLYKDKNIIQIIYLLTGKYIGFIFSILLFLLLLGALVSNARGYIDIMISRFYPYTPPIVIGGAGLFASYLVAKKGLEAIGRTAWLVFPYLCAGMILLLILIWNDLTYEFLFPIAGPGFKEVFINGIKHSSLIGEFMIVALFYPYVKNHKVFRNGTILGFVSGTLLISLLLAEYVMMFDYIAPQKMLHAFSQLTRHTGIEMFINNLDALYLGIFVITAVIRFAFYLYAGAAFYGYTFKMKEFEPLLLPLAIIALVLGMIPLNASQSLLFFRDNLLINYSWGYFFALPLLLWIVAHMKGEFKHAKS